MKTRRQNYTVEEEMAETLLQFEKKAKKIQYDRKHRIKVKNYLNELEQSTNPADNKLAETLKDQKRESQKVRRARNKLRTKINEELEKAINSGAGEEEIAAIQAKLAKVAVQYPRLPIRNVLPVTRKPNIKVPKGVKDEAAFGAFVVSNNMVDNRRFDNASIDTAPRVQVFNVPTIEDMGGNITTPQIKVFNVPTIEDISENINAPVSPFFKKNKFTMFPVAVAQTQVKPTNRASISNLINNNDFDPVSNIFGNK